MAASIDFQETVTKVAKPERHFSYIMAADGRYLGVEKGLEKAPEAGGDADTSIRTFRQTDDRVVWRQDGDVFTHATTGRELTLTDSAAFIDGQPIEVELIPSGRDSGRDEPTTTSDVFTATHGPEKLPSEYLEFFRANGWVCLTSILAPDVVEDLERVAAHVAQSRS